MAPPTVFLSSTYEDLAEHRRVLLEDLDREGYAVEHMEIFESSGMMPLETCLQAVAQSDVTVMVLGYRCGSLVPGYGISFTEAEYEHAQALGHPVYVYLREGFDEGVEESEEDAESKKKLRRLRTTLETELAITRSEFASPAELSNQVLRDLKKWGAAATSRPQFDRPLLDIHDPVAYATKRVMRRQTELHAPHIVLADLSAAELDKFPPPRAGRLAAKIWMIKSELEDRGFIVHLFNELGAIDSSGATRFDRRLTDISTSSAVVVCFAKDEEDTQLLSRFADAGSTTFVWYRDEAPDEAFSLKRSEQWTSQDLGSCALALEVERAIEDHIKEVVLRAAGALG